MTGYGKRYIARFGDINSTAAYQAWVWIKDYAGSAAETYLSEDDPVVIEWGRKGSDIYTPMLASHAKVSGWRITDEFEELLSIKTGDGILEIVRGADHDAIDADTYERVWIGPILADVYEDSTMDDPADQVDIEAIDGIGLLNEVPYYDLESDPPERLPYEGRESLLVILRRALGKIGYDLPVRSAIAWRPGAWTTGEDVLAETELDQLAFYSSDGRAMSAYKVVEEVCRRLGARLCQYEGAWWLVSRELMTGTAYTVHKYTADGTPDGTDTVGAGVDSGTGNRTRGQRSFRPAWSSVAVIQNHGPVPPLIDEGTFETLHEGQVWSAFKGKFTVTRPPVHVSGEWTYEGNAAAKEVDPEARDRVTDAGTGTSVVIRNFAHAVPSYFHGVGVTSAADVRARIAAGAIYLPPNNFQGEQYAEREGGEIGEGQVLTFSGSFTIEHAAGHGDWLFNTYFRLTIEGTNWYLRDDGTWDSAATVEPSVQWMVPPGLNDHDRGVNLGQRIPFSFTSEPAPASGPVKLRLYGSSERQVNLFDTTIDPGDVLWDDVAVVVTDTDGQTLGARRTEVFTTLPDPERDEIVVITGEGPAQELPTTLYYDDAPAIEWRSALLTAPRPLDSLHAETVLRSQTRPLEIRHEAYRGFSLSPVAPLMVGGAAFTAQQVAIRISDRVSEGEFVALLWDAAATVTAERHATDPPGTTYAPSVSGGVSSGMAAGASAVITTHGDLIAGDEDGIEARLAVGEDGQLLSADSTAPLGVAWIDAPEGGGAPSEGLSILRGVATIESGQTSVLVDPIVAYSLQRRNIQIAPASAWGSAAKVWIGDIDDGTFEIKVDADPGEDIDIVWWVIDEPAGTAGNLHVIEVGPGSVTLGWNRVPAADGYILYWSEESDEPYEDSRFILLSELDNQASPTWTVEGLEGETTYYFVVISFVYDGPPPATTLNEPTEDGGVVSLSWDALPVDGNEDLAGWRVYRSDTEGTGHTMIDELGAGATEYDDDDPDPDTTNYYFVRAFDVFGGEGAASNEVNVFVGAPPPWAPSDLDDLVLWLDADDAGSFTLSGNEVSQWSDKSGEGNNATQTTSAQRPLLIADQINGRSVVRFDGTDDGMEIPDLGLGSDGDFTAFIVIRASIPSDNVVFFANPRATFGFQGASTRFLLQGAPADTALGHSYGVYDDEGVNILVIQRASQSQTDAWIGSTALGTTGIAQRWGTSGTWLGRRGSGDYFNGDICELIVYDNILDAPSRNDVTSYLLGKWGP